MKYLDIDLSNDNGTQLIYPSNYQSEIGDYSKDHLYYDDESGLPRLLICIEDADYKSTMIRDRVTELNENQAKIISEEKETRTEIILDEAKVRRLEIKANLGITLTAEEQDALDPIKPNSAFGVNKILSDRIEELKSKESIKLAKSKNELIA